MRNIELQNMKLQNAEIIRRAQIIRAEGKNCGLREDWLIAEYPFTLFGNGKYIREFNCTPCSVRDLEELCAGALFTSGLINCWEDIVSMEIDERKGEGHFIYRESGKCGQDAAAERQVHIGGMPRSEVESSESQNSEKQSSESRISDVRISIEDVHRMMRENLVPTRLFEETGGVHMVSLYNLADGTRLIKKEDAARHNAVDKVIGAALRNHAFFETAALILSGRVSLDILRKARTAGIPVILSKAAPTAQSVEAADEAGITLIGFIREGRMNIYTHPQRVLLPDEVFGQMIRERRRETVRKSRYL